MKDLRLWAVGAFSAALLSACAAQPAQSPEAVTELQLFNWTDYMDPAVLEQFEEETGIRVVESYFSSNEEMIARVQGGDSGFDIVMPSDFVIEQMVDNGLLAELNHENIPNLENLKPAFRGLPYDPENRYSVPYQYGVTAMGYNTEAFPDGPPESWSALFEIEEGSALAGQAMMLDDVREAMTIALLYLGYDPATTDEAQLREAQQLFIQAKEDFAGFDSEAYDDQLASGEVLLVHGWNNEILIAQEQNPDVRFTVPQEGGVLFLDNLAILASTTPERKAAAEQFINFLLRPEIAAQVAEYVGTGTPNQAGFELLPEDIRTNPAIYPTDEQLATLVVIPGVDAEIAALYQRLWDEMKAAN